MIIIIGIGSGIGGYLLSHFANKGEQVLAGSRSTIYETTCGVIKAPIDVCDEASVAKFFTLAAGETIDSLIYCAGITLPKTNLAEFDQANFKMVLDTNVVGFATVMKHALPYMTGSLSRVVAIGSMASRSPSLYSGFEYTSSKHALAGVVRHLARDLASRNILMNCVHPGPVDTPMLRANLSEQDIAEIEKHIPTHKLTTMDDVVSAVTFLIGCQNINITGVGIDVNGGQIITC
mgnify:CR=1 FL=1